MRRRKVNFGFDSEKVLPWCVGIGLVIILSLCVAIFVKLNKSEDYTHSDINVNQLNSQADINAGCYGECQSCVGKASQVMGCVKNVNDFETQNMKNGRGEVFGSDNTESDNLQAEWCCCGDPKPN